MQSRRDEHRRAWGGLISYVQSVTQAWWVVRVIRAVMERVAVSRVLVAAALGMVAKRRM